MAALGIGGLIGLLAGILAVAVIQPLTSSGTTLLMVLCIAIGTVVGVVVRSIRTSRGGKRA